MAKKPARSFNAKRAPANRREQLAELRAGLRRLAHGPTGLADLEMLKHLVDRLTARRD